MIRRCCKLQISGETYPGDLIAVLKRGRGKIQHGTPTAFLSVGCGRLFFDVWLDFGPFSCVTLYLLCQPVMRVTKMPLHRLFRSGWVAGSKSLDDRPVFGNRLLSRAHVFKVLSELEAQGGMTRVEKLCHKANQHAIAGFFGDVKVKCSIRR